MTRIYTSLQHANSIRILQLEPGYGDTPLEAHLAEFRLEEHGFYEALSYTWGEPDLTKSILIGDQNLAISNNLHNILLQLRSPDRIRSLWTDAICIDQDEVNEKGHQVAIMGQIYQHAETVLCWLGSLSTSRLWALKFLERLAEDAAKHFNLPEVEGYWAVLPDSFVPGVNVSEVVQAAVAAHIETIYESDWFHRLWIVQEVCLARKLKLLFGSFEMPWDVFEMATRIMARCISEIPHPPQVLLPMNDAWELLNTRGRYAASMRTTPPFLFQPDHLWSIGTIAYDMRNKKCKEDRDKVYALLSLSTGSKYMKAVAPDALIPDYTRSVEWAYTQFWRRYGGCTSLYFAGLSRRSDWVAKTDAQARIEDILQQSTDTYLPSWAPDLRPQTKAWQPIFGYDFGTSTPIQHMAVYHKNGPGFLMLRGHRIDVVVCGFHIKEHIEPCGKVEDLVNFRATMKFYIALEPEYAPYPTGQSWNEALGSVLMTDMPYDHAHPFQQYLDSYDLKTTLSDRELQRLWKLYQDLVLADTGEVWKRFCAVVASRTVALFDPAVELTHDGRLAWTLQKYISDVLHTHRLIITKEGYMGLAPPETVPGDVVVALGGPSVPMIVRDLSVLAYSEIEVSESRGWSVPCGTGNSVSRLLGPCYLQGIMKAELLNEERYKTKFEWETDQMGTLPKPTLFLI